MKKIYFIIALFLISNVLLADQETICVITNTGSSGQACNSTDLGYINPSLPLLGVSRMKRIRFLFNAV
ncbi:MAG TPA: hypothetical protein VIL78_00160 [Hanamia sp.]